MHTLTAIIRALKGHEELVRAELLKVAAFVAEQERDTVGFYVAQPPDYPCVFTTYERFTDSAAMDRHNAGAGSTGFFAAAGDALDGGVTLVTAIKIAP
ncbi:putative quinol monooxygenase [Sulfitobacter sp.]|uniref:putative quinol monooxygenase n=1 Tax=Sulfitobacter sp. TaxID=1903071 RepID=UPI00300179A5